MRPTICLALTLSLALAACGEGKAPSEKLKDAAEGLVEEAAGETPPKLGDGPYAPRDECAALPGADAFRQQLAQAVAARDAQALTALAASDVKLDFGGGAGSAQLRAKLDGEEASLWDELDTLLTLGCAAEGRAGITLPWYFAQEIDAVEPAKGMIVMGENVPLRLAPDAKAETLKTISWDLVELIDGLEPEASFQHVETTDEQRGYIATDKLRSLLDYRLLASSRDGKWSITSLVAGD
ncbi:hypothetical protein [Pelagerythrobacter rhizovicinus]|uniref:SH3 domain-containing protein n=1 Tax=Pelagerythrobacter rhizovicinus TaxID=2268576 RepID=A0A4Q2KNF6_9SPHN|nr:hypothetical protein [Pelagerythrobacter rhizovicinus]RXZ65840.1 hypothetical protein ETX26_03685 [Pelagerythrobacter rhizovicinus]